MIHPSLVSRLEYSFAFSLALVTTEEIKTVDELEIGRNLL